MQLHVNLSDEIDAFNFRYVDILPLVHACPELTVIHHKTPASLYPQMDEIDLLVTWRFEQSWYARCTNLKAIFTPAAGRDWIAADPSGKVSVHHGTFHGPVLAESLLGAILHMNRLMPMLAQRLREGHWDRNLQADTRLLRNQTVAIIGLGHIGCACASLLRRLGTRVIGVKRDVSELPGPVDGVEVLPVEKMGSALAIADHVVLLLPGDSSTDRFMHGSRLRQMKKGAFIYNFGRGNSLIAEDLLPFVRGGHVAGAFLDVTEEEPLPGDSPLWNEPRVVITPHSSCVCSEYRPLFVEELIPRVAAYVN